MQSAPVGHAPHGAAAEAADIPQINYHGDVDFYHELELRRGFLEVLSNGRNERAEQHAVLTSTRTGVRTPFMTFCRRRAAVSQSRTVLERGSDI